jgi:hypothetical protein
MKALSKGILSYVVFFVMLVRAALYGKLFSALVMGDLKAF